MIKIGCVNWYHHYSLNGQKKVRKKRAAEYQETAEIYAQLNNQDFSSGEYTFKLGDNRTTLGRFRNKPLAPSTP